MQGARRNHDFSYTPAEAARMLRVSPTRVRQLLQDGELDGERDEAGHWLIPARVVHERLERLRRESFLEAVGYDPSIVHAMQERVEVLRDQVELLRAELQEAHVANRENRRIIVALTRRIPEIEAPSEPREAPESVVEESRDPAPPGLRVQSRGPGGGGCSVAKGLGLEDWIGKRVTVAVYSREEVISRERTIIGMEVVSDEERVSERQVVLEVEGFLEGVDPGGVIVLFDPRDVVRQPGGGAPYTHSELRPRHVFYPWQRVALIQRIEEAEEQ